MVLADSSYPLLNLFWTMCILFTPAMRSSPTTN